MVDALYIRFDLDIHRAEDRTGDEPRLQFAMITQSDAGAEVRIHDTGRLANDVAARQIWAQGAMPALIGAADISPRPSREFPFFGMAVRAIDDDSSSTRNRRRDRRAIEEALEQALDPIFLGGRVPSVDEIWQAANAAPMQTSWRDDDDKLGVSARVYPRLGIAVADAVPGPRAQVFESSTLRFLEDDAHWQLDFRIAGDWLR